MTRILLGRPAADREGLDLDDLAGADADGTWPLAEGRPWHRLRLEADRPGHVVLAFSCPRPLRIWQAGVAVLDEPLTGWSFQRLLRAALVLPCPADGLDLLLELGGRPHHGQAVDRDCPSRNRDRTLAAVAARFPDRLRIEATSGDGAADPAALRFLPVQAHRDGLAWQQVLVRPAPEAGAPPGTDRRSAADLPMPVLALAAADGTPAWDAGDDADARAGVRRLLIPVGPSGGAPPVRGEGPDPRPEPELEVVGRLDAVLATAAGSVRVPVPVYEQLGRLAPRREWRPVSWPDPARIAGLAPRPVLDPGDGPLLRLHDEAWAMMMRLARPVAPRSGLPGGCIGTGSNFPHAQFVWDSCFTALALAWGWSVCDVAAHLDLLWSRQHDGGYLHREHDLRDGLPVLYEPDFGPNPPLLATAELHLARLGGDRGRLARIYPAACALHRWIEANRGRGDGTYWTTGLANGLDNSPSLGDAYPCLTSQMAQDAEALAGIAALIGLDGEAASWRRRQGGIAAALNRHLWDARQRFYGTALDTGGHNPAKVVTGFWPLWAGAVPEERVGDLERHLRDPSSFWRPHPLPSLSADHPAYEPGGRYWRGSVWAPTSYAAIAGFWRAGRRELARETARLHLGRMAEVLAATGHLWENYGAEGAVPGDISAPDYCWSAAPAIALLHQVVNGFEPDATAMRLRWTPPPGRRAGIERLRLGPATIDLVQRPGRDGSVIEGRSDLPVELVLATPAGERSLRLGPAGLRTAGA